MILIRRATSKDITEIIEFQVKMAWETENLHLPTETVTRGVEAVFEDGSKGEYWVAESEGKVAASLLITFEWSDWRNTKVWWIQSVYVLPEHRRSGIFRSMYEYIRNESEKCKSAGLRLYVETSNRIAQSTYESLGMSSEHYIMYEWLK